MENNQETTSQTHSLVDVVLERKGSQLFSGRHLGSPCDAVEIVKDFIGDPDREKFVQIGLSTKNNIQLLQVVHTGSLNASIVSQREVMKALILSNCASYIVAHNHPVIMLRLQVKT